MPPRKKTDVTNGEVAPRKKRQAKVQQPVTSKQRLSSIIKRCATSCEKTRAFPPTPSDCPS